MALEHEQYPGRLILPASTAGAIPANCFAKLGTYDATAQRWPLSRPDEDNLSSSIIVGVPEAIPAPPAGGKGICLADGFYVVEAGETLAVDDLVGTKKDSWKAWKMSGGKFQVTDTLTIGGVNIAVVRMVGGGGGYAAIVTDGPAGGICQVQKLSGDVATSTAGDGVYIDDVVLRLEGTQLDLLVYVLPCVGHKGLAIPISWLACGA